MTMGPFLLLSLDEPLRSLFPCSLCCCHRWRPLLNVNNNHTRAEEQMDEVQRPTSIDLHRYLTSRFWASKRPMSFCTTIVTYWLLLCGILPRCPRAHCGVDSSAHREQETLKHLRSGNRRQVTEPAEAKPEESRQENKTVAQWGWHSLPPKKKNER